MPLIAKNENRKRKIVMPNDLFNFDELPDAAHVDVRVVAALFGCKVPTVWARLRRCEVPNPRRFGSHTRWNVGELRVALKKSSN